MFLLHEELLERVEIDGDEYRVDMAYDNILNLNLLLKDDEVSDVDKVVAGLYLLLDIDLSDKYDINTLIDIFNNLVESIFTDEKEEYVMTDIMGNILPSEQARLEGRGEENEDVDYCLYEDAEYIYSSFLQCYGIDLIDVQGELHWDKFNALLQGLSDDSKFMRVVEIRGREEPTGKGTQKERDHLREMKKKYELKGIFK